ncbi:MAG: CHASE3 domain-containing protein [Isosphaeraceae bacterium]
MNWSVGKAATIGFALAVAALLASVWLSYRNVRRIDRNEALVVHSHEVLDTLRRTLTDLVDAETGQRGYLITGEAAYLKPYEAALGSIRTHLDQLHLLTADTPVQQRRLDDLKQKTAARLASLRKGIEARDQDGPEGGRLYTLAGTGRQIMNAIRDDIAKMERAETDLLAVREAESRTSYRTTVVTLMITALMGLALVGTAYALAAREIETRRRSTESLQQANDELEQRVNERTEALSATNESLRRSNSELEQFASVASHDLQEPLRKIQAFGDRLQTRCAEGLGEQGRDYVDRMQASATRMRSLIDALLTFSRVTTKAQPFVPVDLATVAKEVLSDLESRIQQSGGRVDLGPLPTVDADPLQMRQLFQNLISNGLKFQKPGEPPLVQVEGRFLVDSENGQEESRCEIVVRDNGIGFETVYLDRIFEVFQRLHGRQEYEGTGMGLAICRKIAERHGGSITATSAPDQGASFLVTLPIRQPKDATDNNHERETNHDPDGR